MNDISVLSSLGVGQSARVIGLLSEGSIRRRLQDIGVISGTRIDCVMKSPYGDPTAYLIRGAIIALRREDAEKILISEASGGDRHDFC